MAKFQPGQSGNPGGRSKAYREQARYGRSLTNDGKEIIDFWLKVMRDEKADMRHRIDCSDNLMDRISGKPVQAVDLRIEGEGQVAEDDIDWSKVPLEQREEMLKTLATLDKIAMPDEADESVEH